MEADELMSHADELRAALDALVLTIRGWMVGAEADRGVTVPYGVVKAYRPPEIDESLWDKAVVMAVQDAFPTAEDVWFKTGSKSLTIRWRDHEMQAV